LRLEHQVAQVREEADRQDRRTRDLDLLMRLWARAARRMARGAGLRAPVTSIGVLRTLRACGPTRGPAQPTCRDRAVRSSRDGLAGPRLES
jgi:hypothetical protein